MTSESSIAAKKHKRATPHRAIVQNVSLWVWVYRSAWAWWSRESWWSRKTLWCLSGSGCWTGGWPWRTAASGNANSLPSWYSPRTGGRKKERGGEKHTFSWTGRGDLQEKGKNLSKKTPLQWLQAAHQSRLRRVTLLWSITDLSCYFWGISCGASMRSWGSSEATTQFGLILLCLFWVQGETRPCQFHWAFQQTSIWHQSGALFPFNDGNTHTHTHTHTRRPGVVL